MADARPAGPLPADAPLADARRAGSFPAGPLLAYCGDDFTGSTDVLDAFTAAGVPTVLFLEPPSAAALARFPQARCIGLAGTARSRSPAWMDEHLPAAFASLARLGAPLLQYKVCSTFDSSPHIGSIGRAIDIGTRFAPGSRWSPMIIGAPRLNRYQLFGNLFATVDGAGHRLDRHPTMSRHPVTPMSEADLRRHLAQQTSRRIELIDMVQLRRGRGPERLAALQGDDVPVVLIDVLDEETLAEAGRLVWGERGSGLFTASSSGLEYALAAHWRREGWLAETADPVQLTPCAAVAAASTTSTATSAAPLGGAPMAVVSGSCSPVTATQIDWALAHGFAGLRLDIDAALARDTAADTEVDRLVSQADQALRRGQHPLIYSARGPQDTALLGFDAAAARAGLTREVASERIGHRLGQVLRALLDGHEELRRVLVAGGDSSGAVTAALGLQALTVARALAPGAPLCRAWADDARRDGLEIVLKGGQMGGEAFFAEAARA